MKFLETKDQRGAFLFGLLVFWIFLFPIVKYGVSIGIFIACVDIVFILILIYLITKFIEGGK